MHPTYFIKQLVGTAAMPLACGFAIAVVGLIARAFGWRRTAAGLWIGAACLIYLAAIAPVADALLAPLEGRFPPLGDVQVLPPVRYIVVLGSGYDQRDNIPITAALSADGLARITEGVRLMHQLRGARLVVSGGASENQLASAIGYAKFAVELGVDPDVVVKLDKSLDTAEEAGSVHALVGSSPFILVTSAYHMPRAMLLMQLAGAHPIAAPTGQLASRHAVFAARGWIPGTSSLRKTECALHEYMGLAIVD
jgi:uncharacterized SAM-binding protein YcdF (DUF218 family)